MRYVFAALVLCIPSFASAQHWHYGRMTYGAPYAKGAFKVQIPTNHLYLLKSGPTEIPGFVRFRFEANGKSQAPTQGLLKINGQIRQINVRSDNEAVLKFEKTQPGEWSAFVVGEGMASMIVSIDDKEWRAKIKAVALPVAIDMPGDEVAKTLGLPEQKKTQASNAAGSQTIDNWLWPKKHPSLSLTIGHGKLMRMNRPSLGKDEWSKEKPIPLEEVRP